MKILITGALGHIGSRLIRTLPEMIEDLSLILVDNLATQRYCSLFNLPTSSSYSFYQMDVVVDDLSSLVSNVDVIVHLAAFTEASASLGNSSEVEKVNLEGLKRVADLALEQGRKLLFLSTTNMYSGSDIVINDSNFASCVTPANPYAKSKRDAEVYLESLKGLNYTVLRFGTIAGFSPGMRFHTAVNKFMWQANLGQAITVWETALNQKRPYLDIQDACSAICSIFKRNIFKREVYNVVSESLAVSEILEMIKKFYPEIRIELVKDVAMNNASFSVETSEEILRGVTLDGSILRAVEETYKNLFRSYRHVS